MKFLVLWSLAIERLSEPMLKAVLRVPEYAKPLEDQGKMESSALVLHVVEVCP